MRACTEQGLLYSIDASFLAAQLPQLPTDELEALPSLVEHLLTSTVGGDGSVAVDMSGDNGASRRSLAHRLWDVGLIHCVSRGDRYWDFAIQDSGKRLFAVGSETRGADNMGTLCPLDA